MHEYTLYDNLQRLVRFNCKISCVNMFNFSSFIVILSCYVDHLFYTLSTKKFDRLFYHHRE